MLAASVHRDNRMLPSPPVFAEVVVDGRWIMVDPAHRLAVRAAQLHNLTRDELTALKILAAESLWGNFIAKRGRKLEVRSI